MDKDVFDVITDYAVNEVVNDVLLKSDEYKQMRHINPKRTNDISG